MFGKNKTDFTINLDKGTINGKKFNNATINLDSGEVLEEKVNEMAKQVELNNQKLLDKCDEVLELIREAKECINNGNIK